MNHFEQSDQVTYSFLFIVTPLQIISQKSTKNTKKSILIKLGQKTQKTSQLNQPIQLVADVLYSKTLKKYCPIKGIIKVYDINLDGTEVISSVGGFQTQQILNGQKNDLIIEADIGTCKVKMKILTKIVGQTRKNIQIQQKQERKSSSEQKGETKQQNFQLNLQKIKSSQAKTSKQQNLQVATKQRSLLYKYIRSPNIPPLNISNENSLSNDPKNRKFQYEKVNNLLLLNYFQKITSGLENFNGKPWVDCKNNQMTLVLKYKQKNFDQTFQSFIEFMKTELSKAKQQLNNSRIDFNEQLNRQANEQTKLQTKESEKNGLRTQQNQRVQFQLQIQELSTLTLTLKEENLYLKETNRTLQQIISDKENQLEIIKQDFLEIQTEFKSLQFKLKNDSCQIEELKEEVSNLNQIIDGYRQKFGDLKNVKSRALQNQLKQCLIWIDQQTRELELSDFAEETQPSHSPNVSQFIKNIELQGASREQMNSIKQELAGLIKRIDNFLAK